MILSITKSRDPIWKQKFKNVNTIDPKIKKIVADMKETLEFTGGVGLAAPQVGIPLRIFVAAYGELKDIFINPKIVKRSKKATEGEEGCLSVPGYRGLVNRADELIIEYIDLKGKRKQAHLSGYYSRIIQHEFDHLNSTFYLDKIANKNKKVVHFSPIKLVFFGTPEFGAIALKSIFGQTAVGEYDVLLVVTQPDSAIRKGVKVNVSPVKTLAGEFSTPTIQPTKLSDKKVIRKLKKLKPDIFVVASYGQILPKSVLNIPKHGSVNIHASLLPKHRGASPIQAAILKREKYTGVTIMLMNEKMDEGDILAQVKVKIGAKETADDLNIKLAKVGSELLHQVLHLWVNKRIKPRKQLHTKATYTKRLNKDSGFIDWKNLPAGRQDHLEAMIRAYHPWPGVWTYYERKKSPARQASPGEADGKGKNQKQILKLLPNKMVQLEGKQPIKLSDFKQGHKDFKLNW